jgi:stage II sporulation protein P
MNWNKQTLRAGVLAILLAMTLRLIGSGFFADSLAVFSQPELSDFLISGETGRKPTQPTPSTAPNPPSPVIPEDGLGFSKADAQYVSIHYDANRQPNIENLLTQSLSWDLTASAPTVLIYHTHGSEAFTPTADTTYEEEGGDYRTLNDQRNMISVGDELTRLLEAAGIGVIHDRTCYDHPDYTAAYSKARLGIQKILQEHPTIRLVIDLHRDAAEQPDGSQWAPTASVNGQDAAQIMFVIGTDSYYENAHWQTNLSIALKLNVLMEKTHPGIARPIDLRRQRFNQDLMPGAMIVEIGAAGNTLEQAKNAVSVLAEAIVQLSGGTN